MEEWRTVEMAPAYQVSSLGRVKRVGSGKAARVGRILKPFTDKDGYLQVSLSTRNKIKGAKVHTLVLLAFVGPRPSTKHECAHYDNDRANNRSNNLSWKTSKENHADKIRHGTHGKTLTIEEVMEIRARRSLGHTYEKISNDLAIGRSAVAHVVKGHCWVGL